MKLFLALLFFAGFVQAATITGATTNLKPAVGFSLMTKWGPMATGDVGTPLDLPNYRQQTVQVYGTFGAGAVTMEGSMDGTNWATLKDTANADIILMAAGIREIVTNQRYMRPNVAGGAASGIYVQVLSIR